MSVASERSERSERTERSKRWLPARAALRSFALFTGLALAEIFSSYVQARASGMETELAGSVFWHVVTMWLWFALLPLVSRATLRIFAKSNGLREVVVRHAPFALGLSVAHLVVFLPMAWGLKHYLLHDPLTFTEELQNVALYLFERNLVVYAGIVLVLSIVHHRHASEAARLKAAEMEGKLSLAKLQALRMQLNPHFLFNTLNAISALTLQDPRLAKAMIAKLGEFLRLTLDEGECEALPLRRELQFLDCYLSIERLRFQDRLQVDLDVAEEALDAQIPYLILQPLVENALRHGLSPRPSGGKISVHASVVGGELLLRVDDDGEGLPEDVRFGVGLGNTRARLQWRYGDAAQFTLAGRPGGGTRAAMRLPLEVSVS